MDEEIMWYVEQIRSEWGKKKLLGYLRVLAAEESRRADGIKKEPREGRDQGEQRAQGV